MLSVRWSDGTVGEFASIWLRDNLAEDRERPSGQRLVDVTDLPRDPRIRSAELSGANALIGWQDEALVSTHALDWLYEFAAGRQRVPERERRLWLEGSGLSAQRDFGWLSWPQLQANDSARLAWLTRLLQDGLAFLRAVPREEGTILEAMGMVGFVAETNYGRLFDVRVVEQPENLAFSDRGLGLHADNPYRDPVPGFQALHTLLAAPDGGDSLFADGIALAAHLRSIDPDSFELLTRTPVPFRYRGTGADLYAERPLIALDCTGGIAAVAYNNRSIQPLRLPPAQCRRYYAAYRRFAELLREPRFQLATRLEGGDLALFDNQRILHGRTGFASARHPRHLQGCYLTRDSVYSRTALLRQGLSAGLR
ncbi:MAG: TauD/TfdA family dioxygenase [Gammaproteobacteria bacterium]|nr:TauD/TfdA family dioxygenase [Gammaproteobacteria bacterium]MDE2252499.1 TauD/TfdA family dioxygenase [Gammaproteobacteria bacterium]